jgi:tetratricopeptide (TPR) repeat protein
MFAQAIETDPDYSLAYAGLADCHSYLYMFWVATEENLIAADVASRKAVDLDPDSAEAHVARGVAISLRKATEEAEKEFQTALELNPDLFEAYYFCARGHYARGNLEAAVAWFQSAHEARPEDYQAPCLMGSALAGLNRMEESAAAFRMTLQLAAKRLELNPGEARALYFSAISLVQLGEQKERSLELAERALAMDPEEPQVLYNVACVYALLGQSERAIDCLEQVIAHGDWWRSWTEHDPDLVSLRGHSRFQALLQLDSAPSRALRE